MTISVAISSTTALGDGVTTAFEFDFVASTIEDIKVIVTADGVQSLIDPVLYSVALNAAAESGLWGVGGVVTYPLPGSNGVPLPTGATITMTRTVPYTQTVSVINQGAFYPKAVEQALDLLEMQIQQIYGLQSSGSSSSAGNVVGPTSSSDNGVAYFIGGDGQRLGSTVAGTAGYILTGNGPATPPSFQLPPGQANGLILVTTYTTGSHVLSAPTYATFAMVTMIGGGGGGEGAAGNPGAGNVSVGSGGSGAGWLQVLVSASAIDGQTLDVGAKGLGGAAGNNNGANGSDTTLLSYTAFGGLGGTSGTTSSTPPYSAHVMAGGSVSGSALAASRPGGDSGADLTTSTSVAFGGHGGDSELAPITGPATCGTDGQMNGANASGFGGGGGGGVASGTGTSASGGNGSDGSATIAWYGPVPANTGISEATQAQQEAGSPGTVYVAPEVQQFHDSAAKVIAVVASDGTLQFGYNVAGVSHSGTGQYTVSFSNAFTTTTAFGCIVTIENHAPGEPGYFNKTTTSVDLNIADGHTPDEHDNAFTLTCYGRLA